jgi:hypothetical protein
LRHTVGNGETRGKQENDYNPNQCTDIPQQLVSLSPSMRIGLHILLLARKSQFPWKIFISC